MVTDRARPHPQAMLGPDSASWRLRHPLRFLGTVRAGLMQLARPEIARAVAATGSFEDDQIGRIGRTLGVVGTVKFGAPREVREAIELLRRVHLGVPGVEDPALRWWVLATSIDSQLELDRRYIGMADDCCRRRFYEESRVVAMVLGIPDAFAPVDLDTFEDWFNAEAADLRVSDEAHRLGTLLLGLPGTWWLTRAGLRGVTADLLPPAVREGYGLSLPPIMPVAASVSRAALRTALPFRGRIPGRPGRRLEQRVLARFP